MKSLLGNWLLKSLDKGDLSRELTSTQGYSLELGLILLEHIEGQLNRSDTKAQFTLAANTIIVGVSIAFGEKGIASAIFDGNALFLTRLTGVLSTMLYFCLLHSTIFALTAVMPKFTFPTKSDNIFYFGAILGTSEPEFLEKMKNISAEELNDIFSFL